MAVIGIMDSGVGGLSVLKELRKLLPNEDYIYFADSKNCPYGDRSPEFIISRCREITAKLTGMGARLMVIACNTATAAAIDALREDGTVPFIGMEPAVKPAALASKSGVIGVLATAGTLGSEKYLRSRDKYSGMVTILENVGKGFVELVEAGKLDGPEAEAVVRERTAAMLEAGADGIALGCTHYPFLQPVMEKIAGPGVKFYDPAPAVAKRVQTVMEENGIDFGDSSHEGKVTLLSSSNPEVLEKLFSMI